MYCIKLKNNRINARCVSNNNIASVVSVVLDTGAPLTIISADSLLEPLDELQFATADYMYLGGIVKGSRTKIYKYHVKQFTIGTIDLGEQDIWIVFDINFTDNVLGFDLLSQISFYFSNIDSKMYIFKDFQEMQSYMIKDNKTKNIAASFRNKYNQ